MMAEFCFLCTLNVFCLGMMTVFFRSYIANTGLWFLWCGVSLGLCHGALLCTSSCLPRFTTPRLVGVIVTYQHRDYSPLTCIASFLQKSPAQSQDSNRNCLPGTFYDNHDLWHMLSAIALYSTASVSSFFDWCCSNLWCIILCTYTVYPH